MSAEILFWIVKPLSNEHSFFIIISLLSQIAEQVSAWGAILNRYAVETYVTFSTPVNCVCTLRTLLVDGEIRKLESENYLNGR